MVALFPQQVPQGLATVESEEVVERPSQGTPRGREAAGRRKAQRAARGQRPQGVAVQQTLVVLDAQGAQDVAQVPGEGQEVQVLEEAQVREAAQGEEVLAMVVVDEEGQGCVEEVPVQGQEVQVLEEEQVLEGPVGGFLFSVQIFHDLGSYVS